MAASYCDAEEEPSRSGLSFTGKQVLLHMQPMEWIYAGVGWKSSEGGVLTGITAVCVCVCVCQPAVREIKEFQQMFYLAEHRDFCSCYCQMLGGPWSAQCPPTRCRTLRRALVESVRASFGIKTLAALSNLSPSTEDLNSLKLCCCCFWKWWIGWCVLWCSLAWVQTLQPGPRSGSSRGPLCSHVVRADVWYWCCV